MPCGDMAQAIVYILARFGCANSPKRIAPRLVRFIPVWHKRFREKGGFEPMGVICLGRADFAEGKSVPRWR